MRTNAFIKACSAQYKKNQDLTKNNKQVDHY